MVLEGTSRLLPNTSGNMARNPNHCTACGVFTSRPMSAENQHMASANTRSSRQAATAARGEVVMRNPRIMPKPSVTATEML
jgi:hypothetical protein